MDPLCSLAGFRASCPCPVQHRNSDMHSLIQSTCAGDAVACITSIHDRCTIFPLMDLPTRHDQSASIAELRGYHDRQRRLPGSLESDSLWSFHFWCGLQSLEATMQDGSSRSAQTHLLQSLRQLLQGLGKGSSDPAAATSWATLCFLRVVPPACIQLQHVLGDPSQFDTATVDPAANADLQARTSQNHFIHE